MIDNHLKGHIAHVLETGQRIGFLCGAGISAESGIPTFRGEEGYWKIGSVNYEPQEISTYAMFKNQPEEVWKWFLFRVNTCYKAQANQAHKALVSIEETIGDQFFLISQNVDRLHRLAGNTDKRSCYIYGDLSWSRCGSECSTKLYPFPNCYEGKDRNTDLTAKDIKQLKCPSCGNWLRPHVLWFDEYYREDYYKSETAVNLASEAGIIFTIGSTGATTLPSQIADMATYNGTILVDINPEENWFANIAKASGGFVIQEKASIAMKAVQDCIVELMS